MTKHTKLDQQLAQDLSKRFQILYKKHGPNSATINYDIMLAFLNIADNLCMNCDDYFSQDWSQHFNAVRGGLHARREAWSRICGVKLDYVD